MENVWVFFQRNTNLFITLNLVADKGKETVFKHTIFQLAKASYLILYRILTEKNDMSQPYLSWKTP